MQKVQHEIKPEEVVHILKENNTIVTLDEAKIILEFMNNWAKMALEEYVKNEE